MKAVRNERSNMSRLWYKYKYGIIFFAPFFILFAVFTLLPVVVAFGMSFTNYDLLQTPKWVGIENFKILFMEDDIFQISLKNTIVLAVVTGISGYIGSFLMAWVINQLRFRTAISLAFYAPSITSGIAMSVVWSYIFSPDRYGVLNNLLTSLGIVSEPILWTTDSNYVLPAIMVIQIWMSMGTGFLVFLAGFQSINTEIYEAGRIDGIGNKYQELIYLTFPQMKPQLLFGAINTCVSAFGIFDIPVAFAGLPSANYSAHTLVAHLYDYAFIRFEMGYASAVAVVLFVIVFFLGRIFMKLLSSKD